jgi:hypothetical protein
MGGGKKEPKSLRGQLWQIRNASWQIRNPELVGGTMNPDFIALGRFWAKDPQKPVPSSPVKHKNPNKHEQQQGVRTEHLGPSSLLIER